MLRQGLIKQPLYMYQNVKIDVKVCEDVIIIWNSTFPSCLLPMKYFNNCVFVSGD